MENNLMESEYADFCCPIDPQRNSKWLEKLQRQQEMINAKHNEKLLNRI
jgi:hypothetical protein